MKFVIGKSVTTKKRGALIWIGLCILLSIAVFGLSAVAAATELTIVVPGHSGFPQIAEARAKAWKDAYPQYRDVEVNVVGGQIKEVQVMTAGGTPPDIIQNTNSNMPAFIFSGLLREIDSFVEKDRDFSRDGMIPSTLETLVYKNQLYGLPGTWSAVGTLYNKNLLDERGLGVPGNDWTWDDLVEFGRKATHDSDGDGEIDHFGFSDSWPVHNHRWPVWVWGAGGQFYNEDLTQSRLDEERALQGIEFFTSLYLDSQIALKGKHGVATRHWKESRLAFFNTTRFSVTGEEAFDLGVLPLPMGPEARTSILVANFYGIHPASPHADIAWSLVKFMASEEAFPIGAEFARSGSGEALSAHLQVARKQLLNAAEEQAMNWIEVATDSMRAENYHPFEWIPIDWKAIAAGEVPARQAVLSAVETYNAVLKEAWDAGKHW